MNAADIESPCIGVCAMHATLERCIGCQRTRSEIAHWLRFTARERRAIIAELPRRRTDFDAATAPDPRTLKSTGEDNP